MWQDSRLVVEKFKSGFPHPEDIPFEDLSVVRNGSSIGSDSSSNGGGINTTINLSGTGGFKSETKSGTMSAMKQKKRSGIFGIFNAGKVINNRFCILISFIYTPSLFFSLFVFFFLYLCFVSSLLIIFNLCPDVSAFNIMLIWLMQVCRLKDFRHWSFDG